jgi:hypothetical protein
MNSTSRSILAASAAVLCAFLVASARADSFGSGGNAFTIDFVTIGNPGNADDAGAGGGIYSSPYGGVSYSYRMGTYEISQDAITKASASTPALTNVVAGAWGASQPAANMTWYEAAAFVNWMNTSTGHQAAYDLSFSGSWSMNLWSSGDAWQADGENLFRHKDAYYFLPSENEWYKAAFHKNDGVTVNYWDYATGSNNMPDGIDFNGDTAFDAVFDQGFSAAAPNAVANVGLTSAYGTFGQNGNVYEWMESANDGINNDSSESRVFRGGNWVGPESVLRSSVLDNSTPAGQDTSVGFRVASVPEPSCALLMFSASLLSLARRRRRTAL